MIDMASAYATFANGGKRAPAFAAVEIKNSRGDVIFRRDRDMPAPQQVIAPNFIQDMVSMMMGVVENGTGKRAALGITKVAGKTGTTNGYKDAWFVGYTGNYVGAVWYGNDDYQAMQNMTGGTLPAQTWHDIMVYAHTGIGPETSARFGAWGCPCSASGLRCSKRRPSRRVHQSSAPCLTVGQKRGSPRRA